MRAILLFHNCEGQSHKTVSTDHNVWRERKAEADSNRGPSAYQPNVLPLGQTVSQMPNESQAGFNFTVHNHCSTWTRSQSCSVHDQRSDMLSRGWLNKICTRGWMTSRAPAFSNDYIQAEKGGVGWGGECKHYTCRVMRERERETEKAHCKRDNLNSVVWQDWKWSRVIGRWQCWKNVRPHHNTQSTCDPWERFL